MNNWIKVFSLSVLLAGQPGPCAGEADAIPGQRISSEEEKRLQKKYSGYRRVDENYVHAGEAALDRWMDWKWGLRIHWGLYTLFAGEKPWSGESWLLPKHRDDKEWQKNYYTSYQVFNPTGFNADEWMKIMKRGGMKYFSFTTKHHDGFCLWPTKTLQKGFRKLPDGTYEDVINHFSVAETPFQRDIVGELVKAGRAHGLGVSLYYSHIDWHDWDFGWDSRNFWYDPQFTKASDPARWAAFIQKERDQVAELLTKYGPIDTVCFDMSWGECKEKAFDIAKLARELQPNTLLRNRGTEMYGDYSTPEGEIPSDPNEMKMPWQVIYPCGTGASYRLRDHYKSKEWVLESLIDIVAKGGNFQVGFGPDAQGQWPQEMIDRVSYVGDWLKVNGECIFSTRPYLRYHEGADLRFTRSKDKQTVYIISLVWPGEALKCKMVKPKPGSVVRMLGVNRDLAWRQEGETLVIDLPKELQSEAKRPAMQAYAFKVKSEVWEKFADSLPVEAPLPSKDKKARDKGASTVAAPRPPAAPAAAEKGELLYNGIQLPKEWPPVHTGQGPNWTRRVRPVPYLQKEQIPAVIPIDVGRQLFFDDFLIQETDLKRKFHQPERYNGNPLLRAETAIEMHDGKEPMAAMISDGFCYDPAKRHFKLWYEAGWRDGTMMATSLDGLDFTRPDLDIEAGTNRVLPKRKNMVRHGTGIAFDPYTTDPAQRFKMTIYENDSAKAWAYTSPDGIHWDNRGSISECGDNTTIFYNPFRKKWVYSIRKDYFGRARFYREHDDFLAGRQWVSWDDLNKDRKSGAHKIKSSDAEVLWAHADDLDLPDPEIAALMPKLKADPKVPKFRVKLRSDGTKVPFPFDDVETQLYNVEAVAYESIMLGVFGIHRGPENGICSEILRRPKLCDLQLAYSRDGFHWDRPDRTDFLSGSRKEGSWDRAYLHAGVGVCTVMGDKLFFYYSGWSGISPALTSDWYAGGATGVAMLRRDGFASMDAGNEAGSLTTRPVKFKGKHLFVNVNAPKGELLVEVLDEDGRMIAPFSMANCAAISGDKTKQLVSWKGVDDLSGLSERHVRFRFSLRQGELYSFWVSPEASGASFGYVAAGGPAFPGPVDTTGM